MNPEQRKRDPNVPVGLKNIGNTCYFNSILQVYFNLPDFVKAILEFKDDGIELTPFSNDKSIDDLQETQFLNRLKQSHNLIKNMKLLFASMTIGNKKYADPTDVLRSITNIEGRPLELGDQQDIGEFNAEFLSRIQDGLNYKAIYDAYIKNRKSEEEKKLKTMQQAQAEEVKDEQPVNETSAIMEEEPMQIDTKVEKESQQIVEKEEPKLDQDIIC